MLKAIEWHILTKNGDVQPEITGETTLTADTESVNIFIKTFDGSDVYVNGEMLYFPSSKAKEMPAIMVEKRGGNMSLSQMTYLLYGNIEERTAKNSLRVVYYRLHMNLVEHGIEQMLIKKRRSYAIDTELLICDFHEFVKDNSDYVTLFSGSYMPEYTWTEDILPYLRNPCRRYNEGLI